MARILNLIIVILELIAVFKTPKEENVLKSFVYYTRISNLIAFISSLLLVFLGQKPFIEVLRYLSTSMLVMTFFVTACILVPLTMNLRGLMLSGSGLFHHLLVPVLSLISYLFAEDRVSFIWFLLPVAVTLIYGLTMLYLNHKGLVVGPYPFFRTKAYSAGKITLWMGGLVIAVSIFSGLIGYHNPLKTDVKYVFVHGLAGWGSYDTMNDFVPYWGLTGGSIIRHLNNNGYDSYAASVDPTGSAWDRACELYAQLTGSRVDYGAAHSKAAGHERFGEDFTGRALISDFDSSRVALIGHSFGGATIRIFSEILKSGNAEEIATTEASDLSPFFAGGNGDNLVAIVTLAAPTNGTTAYDMYEDENFDLSSIEIPEEYERNSDAVSNGTRADLDGRASWDYASYDMHIDNAFAMNERISTFDDVYYLAYPCSSSVENPDGSVSPDPSITESIFMKGAIYMSKYEGSTAGGIVIDSSWQANDGLVNEISAGAPFNAPQAAYDPATPLSPGKWYVMPTFRGDHMSLQGGLTKRINVKPFYDDLVRIIAEASL